MAQTLTADEGKVYTNGTVFGKIIMLPDSADISAFIQITDEEYSYLQNADSSSVKRNHTFWSNFQEDGNRKGYEYAFAGWEDDYIQPYFILLGVTKVNNMFANCKNLTTAKNIYVHIDKSQPSINHICAGCENMKVGPNLCYEEMPIVKTFMSAYENCRALESVNIYWGDGTKNPLTERNNCQNLFLNCENLTEVDFGAANTGSPNKLDLSVSTKLSGKSYRSLVESLQDVSEADEAFTIKVHSSAIPTIQLYDADQKELDNEYVSTFQLLEDKGWKFEYVTA